MEKRVERWRIFLLERMIKAVNIRERYRNVLLIDTEKAWRPEIEKAWFKKWVVMAQKVWLMTPDNLRRVAPENSYPPGDFSVLKWNTFFGFRLWLYGVILNSLNSGISEYTFDFTLEQLRDRGIESQAVFKQLIKQLSHNWSEIIKVRCQSLGRESIIVIFAVRHLDSIVPPKAF